MKTPLGLENSVSLNKVTTRQIKNEIIASVRYELYLQDSRISKHKGLLVLEMTSCTKAKTNTFDKLPFELVYNMKAVGFGE